MCSGIAAGGGGSGFEMDQEDAITLVQLVISKCLDREILCNELYLQLVKQTTDQPGELYCMSTQALQCHLVFETGFCSCTLSSSFHPPSHSFPWYCM